jgi:ferredoxin
MPKVTIDQDECIACGRCYNDNCPDVFEEGEDGKSQLKASYRKDISGTIAPNPRIGEIPTDLLGCVQKAANICPVSAITVH